MDADVQALANGTVAKVKGTPAGLRTGGKPAVCGLRWRRFGAAVLLMLARVASLRGDCAGEKTSVAIGFEGFICAVGSYTVTLAGTVAAGLGDRCLVFTATERAYAQLKVDRTYVVTAGSGICCTNIHFDVPAGYSLYVDGREATSIWKCGTSPGAGDGSWNVVVREKCREEVEAGESGGTGLGSVVWTVGLGDLSDGRSAERISLHEEVLTAAIYTPAALIYSPPGLGRASCGRDTASGQKSTDISGHRSDQ